MLNRRLSTKIAVTLELCCSSGFFWEMHFKRMDTFCECNRRGKLSVLLPSDVIDVIRTYVDIGVCTMRCHLCASPTLWLNPCWWMPSGVEVKYIIDGDYNLRNVQTGSVRRPVMTKSEKVDLKIESSRGSVCAVDLPLYMRYGTRRYANEESRYHMSLPYFMINNTCICYVCRWQRKRLSAALKRWLSVLRVGIRRY